MKARNTGLLIVLFFGLLLFNTMAFASVNDDQVTSQKIREADGTSGQNTNSGSGVKTGHIQDGAVTDAKISGVISGAKLGSHTHSGADITDGTITNAKIAEAAITPDKIGFYSNVIVVALSGGDFTSPVDAMNAITDASATNPYLVKIMPGVYDVGSQSVQMKEYVDIEGSGQNTTKIFSAVGPIGVVRGAANAEIRFLTIEASCGNCVNYGMRNDGGAPSITNSTIVVRGDFINWGIFNLNASPFIKNVIINVAGNQSNNGVYTDAGNVTIESASIIVSSGIGFSAYGVTNYPGTTTNLSFSKIVGNPAISNFGTMRCIGLYDANYDAITCP